MKRLLFKELMHPNNQLALDASTIASMALKQVSKGRFEIVDEQVISIIRFNKEQMEVVFTNDIDVRTFQRQLCSANIGEQSLKFMYSKTAICESTLFEMLKEYKQKYYIQGTAMGNIVCFKLYSKVEIKDEMKDLYQVEWIDYESQLENGNIIYDIFGVNGLFTFTEDTLYKCFNEVCEKRYGGYLLIVKPLPDCFYVNDEKEIIGDRFEVIDKIDLNKFEDIGRLINCLHQIDIQSKKEMEDKLHEEMRAISTEKATLFDAYILLKNNFDRIHLRKWMWLIAGILLGIILSWIF